MNQETRNAKFAKYAAKGAYHWDNVSRSLRKHNAFTHARYVRALRALHVQPGQRVLDVGCGDGVLSAMIAQAGAHVIGIDYVPAALRFAVEHTLAAPARFVAGSAYALPFVSSIFDAVVAAEIIEHLDRPDDFLAEIHRVLRPGGRSVIMTPHRLTEQPLDPEHVKEFFPDEVATCLSHFFVDVTLELSHPVWLLEVYQHKIAGKRVIKLVMNFSSVYLGRNPFLTDRRYLYYAQIVATGVKA